MNDCLSQHAVICRQSSSMDLGTPGEGEGGGLITFARLVTKRLLELKVFGRQKELFRFLFSVRYI